MDAYQILKIPTSATPIEIKSAYRKMALRWHPDKVPPEKRAEACKKFLLISQAYETLINPQKRLLHEKFGQQAFGKSSSFHIVNLQKAYQMFNNSYQDDMFQSHLIDDPMFQNKSTLDSTKLAVQRIHFDLTLEECWQGGIKKIPQTGQDSGENVNQRFPEKIVKFPKGVKCPYHQIISEPNQAEWDVTFSCLPHSFWQRNQNQVEHVFILPWIEVFSLPKKETVIFLDQTSITVELSLIHVKGEKIHFPHKGMPFQQRGNWYYGEAIIWVEIDWQNPFISLEQCHEIKQLLSREQI